MGERLDKFKTWFGERWKSLWDAIHRNLPRNKQLRAALANVTVGAVVGTIFIMFWSHGREFLDWEELLPESVYSTYVFVALLAVFGVPALWRTLAYYKRSIRVATTTLGGGRFIAPFVLVATVTIGSIGLALLDDSKLST